MPPVFDRPLRQQSTLVDCATVSGFGFWSGQDVRLEFRPATANTGITFVREDLPGTPRIPASVQLREDKPRRTNLTVGSHSVEMVEHVLAALARPATQGMTVEYHLDYGENCSLQTQSACHLVTRSTFVAALAPARTFVLQHEAEQLRSVGLGLRVTNQDLLVFGPAGPIGNHLRFEDECARHKALDMVGDLALCGVELIGHFIAYRSGHQLNAELGSCLRELYETASRGQRVAS
jgi:UDP-3-O-acyl-N-acetylglucosamine deacetylase